MRQPTIPSEVMRPIESWENWKVLPPLARLWRWSPVVENFAGRSLLEASRIQ